MKNLQIGVNTVRFSIRILFKNSLHLSDNPLQSALLPLQLNMQAVSTFQWIDASSATQRLVYETGQQIPGSVHYAIKRFAKPEDWMSEDLGMVYYHYAPTQPDQQYVELRFCVTGNMYCRQYNEACCARCIQQTVSNCNEKIETIDMFSFVFKASFLNQFTKTPGLNTALSEDILAFTHTSSFTKPLPLCNKTRAVLDSLVNHNHTGALENIYVNAQTQMLLLYSLDCLQGEKEINTITCKFLANEADRDKVLRAREILIEHIGEPITIKELSRKVAMNECYLKKGFKQLFGTTIFEFYQTQR
ncbi:MAG TPA: AraC family transcriptional regulator, partial [Flavisolibacter sp.]|nr:AraC family transcriptional regulator [Flavisolibacter sp.]